MSASEGSGWVVEPPGPDAAFVSVNVADDAELTPELRQALERLVQAISEPDEVEDEGEETAEASGFQVFRPRCPHQTACVPFTVRPCLARSIVECTIVDCTTYVKPAPEPT